MEILRRQLDLLRSRLSPDDARAVSDEALAAIPDVYPFNPCEYYAARLIDRGVLSFGQYEALRADYLRRNVNLPLYTLAPRTFGQTWGEPYVRSLLPGALRPSRDLDPGYSGQYDLWLPGGPRPLRIEVKAARVAVARPGGTLVSKALQKATCGRVPFDLNFQQLKPGCCDAFVWLGVWADTIDHWVLSPDDVRLHPSYSNQHRNSVLDADGRPTEGQIHINNDNYHAFDRYACAAADLGGRLVAAAAAGF